MKRKIEDIQSYWLPVANCRSISHKVMYEKFQSTFHFLKLLLSVLKLMLRSFTYFFFIFLFFIFNCWFTLPEVAFSFIFDYLVIFSGNRYELYKWAMDALADIVKINNNYFWAAKKRMKSGHKERRKGMK